MSDAFSFTAGITLDLERFKRDLDKAAEYARAAFANLRLGLDGSAGAAVARAKAAYPQGILLNQYGGKIDRSLSSSVKEASDNFEAAARSVEGMAEACDRYSKTAASAGTGLARAAAGRPAYAGARPPTMQPAPANAPPQQPQPAPQGGGMGRFTTAMLAFPGLMQMASMAMRPFTMAFENFASRESLAINLGTLLGDDERGAAFQKRLQDYAAHTPYAQNDLAGTAQTLLQYGASEDDAEKWLKQLGDISMGDRNKFSSLGLALGQVMSVGRLQGQDLLQMINAGFNPLSVIAEETGRSMAELKEAMSRGEIGFDQVAMALERATAEGGKFYQGAERGSKTFQGLISTITDNFSIALGTAVENSQGNFRAVLETWANFDWAPVIEGLSGMVRVASDVAVRLNGIVASLAGNRRLIDVAAAGIKGLVYAIAGFQSLKLLNMAKEVGAFTASLKGFGGQMGGLRGTIDSLSKSAAAAGVAMTGIIWGLKQIVELVGAVAELKSAKGEETDRGQAYRDRDMGLAAVKRTFAARNEALEKTTGANDPNARKWRSETQAAFEKAVKEYQRNFNGAWKGIAREALSKEVLEAAGIKTEEEAKKAVAKAAKQDITYAPVTNNNTTNVTQNNEISSDFNDIGKLIRENLVEILRSQLTFRRDREEMAGAGA